MRIRSIHFSKKDLCDQFPLNYPVPYSHVKFFCQVGIENRMCNRDRHIASQSNLAI